MAIEAKTHAGLGSVGTPFELSTNRFCFNQRLNEELHLHPQQLQQQSQFLLPHHQLQTSQHKNRFPPTKPTTVSMPLSQIIATQLEFQRVEIDNYINLQNERLKSALREKRKQHLASFIKKLEFRVAMSIRQKDQEIALASRRAMDLQQYMKRIEVENQTWRKIAGDNEAMIANLNTSIEMTKASMHLQQKPSREVEDTGSCCDVSIERDNKRRKKMDMVCRRCNFASSSIVLLPCRHLCCCKDCEAFVYSCPVCNSAKQGCIEALVS